MNRKSIWRVLLAGLVVAGTVLVAGPAAAQDEGESETARETGPIVRHKLLYRSTRVELTPLVGMTVNDAFLRNGVVGAQFAYHLTNEFGIAFTGGYSPVQLKTDLYNNVEAELENEADSNFEEASFSYIQWMAGLEIQYVPIFGKFSLSQSLISNYDIHLLLGISAIGQNAQSAVDGNDPDPQLSGINPSPMIGLGFRLFTSDALAITVQARDYLYSRAVVSTGTADADLTNNFFVSVGASFFFPGEVKISR